MRKALLAWLIGAVASAALLLAPLQQARAQNSTGLVVATCGSPPTAFVPGRPGPYTVDPNGNNCITGSFSATLAGFTPNGNFGTLTATAASSGSTALPAGAVVAFQNKSTVDLSCVLSAGAATATTDKLIVRAGATVFLTVGSNVNAACINQTGAASNVVVLAGGVGLGTNFGGGGGGGSSGAVFGPTANGSPAANPPVLMGGTANGTGTGNVTNMKVDAAGTAYIDAVAAGALLNAITASIPSGTNPIGTVQPGNTPNTVPWLVNQSSPYPTGAVPITASATGTTAATTATLAGAVGKTTYICGYSIRANATAATTVTNTITGVITATLSSVMWVAPLASGLGVDEQIFSPCIPASATNTGIAVVSGAPGAGGTVSSKGWGYQL